jgi:hypothetical protein
MGSVNQIAFSDPTISDISTKSKVQLVDLGKKKKKTLLAGSGLYVTHQWVGLSAANVRTGEISLDYYY